ncbi:N-acylneuraminate-9-phosphatase-like [Glandiceps talaboti]
MMAAVMKSSANGVDIKLLIFDLDNTLVETKNADKLAVQEVKKLLKQECPDNDVDKVVCTYKKYLSETEIDPENKLPVDEWRTKLWTKAISNGSPVSSDLPAKVYTLWKETRLKNIYFTQEIKDLLERLRQKYKLALMTNGDSKVQSEKVAVSNAEAYFDSIIISGDYEHAKPHPSIYDVAFKQFSVSPKQCVMIGDNLKTDIAGGLNSGLYANIWINPTGQEPSGCDPEPCYSLSNVLLLEDVLKDLGNCKSTANGPSTWDVQMMNIM